MNVLESFAVFVYQLVVISLAIWREARGQSYKEKLAVGQTIENRVRDLRWPETYSSVVLQPWQFSSFNKNDPNATKFPIIEHYDYGPGQDRDVLSDCMKAALEVLVSETDFANGANHYHAKGSDPGWRHVDGDRGNPSLSR